MNNLHHTAAHKNIADTPIAARTTQAANAHPSWL
jgi:hypothetical protein